MNSCTIELTPAAEKHGNLYLTKCPKDFFPEDIYGASSRKKGKTGNPITLHVAGRDDSIETDNHFSTWRKTMKNLSNPLHFSTFKTTIC